MSDSDELELLELERQKAQSGAVSTEQPPPNYSQRVQQTFTNAPDELRNEIQKTAAEDKNPNLLGALHATGALAGTVAKEALSPITEIPIVKKGMQGLGNLVSKAIPEGAKNWFAEHPNTMRAAGDIGNIAGVATAPVGGSMVKVPEAVRSPLGGLAINAGKSNLISGAKLSDKMARNFSSNVEYGAQKYANLVDKHDLQSATGGFRGIAKNAQDAIDTHSEAADNIIQNIKKENPEASANVDNVALKFMDDISQGKEDMFALDPDRAINIVDKIYAGLERKGLSGVQPIDKLPEVKQTINSMIKGFTKGAPNISSEPYVKQVGDVMYLRMKQELENLAPEIAEHNNAIHDLLNVKAASEAAAKRIGNRDKIGLKDWLMFAGIKLSDNAMGKTGGVTLPIVPAAAVMANKLASGGRGSSALISLGKLIKGGEDVAPGATSALNTPINLGSIIKKNLPDITNERGAIGIGAVENPQIHTPEFKNWFGDWKNAPESASKVVDESGKPFTVYSGGLSKDYEFDKGRSNMGAGFFTNDKTLADQYSRAGQPTNTNGVQYDSFGKKINPGKTTEAYLNIKKPITDNTSLKDVLGGDIEYIKDDLPEHIYELYKDDPNQLWRDIDNGKIVLNRSSGEFLPTDAQFKNNPMLLYVSNILESYPNSYMSKKIKDMFDGIISHDDEVGGTTYIPFSPSQIKSATGNSGAFSKLTNDIRGNTNLSGLKMAAGMSGIGLGALTGYAALRGNK